MLTRKCTYQRVCSLVSLLSIMGSSEMLLSTSTMTSKLQHVKNVYYGGVTQELGNCSLILLCQDEDKAIHFHFIPLVAFDSGKCVHTL